MKYLLILVLFIFCISCSNNYKPKYTTYDCFDFGYFYKDIFAVSYVDNGFYIINTRNKLDNKLISHEKIDAKIFDEFIRLIGLNPSICE